MSDETDQLKKQIIDLESRLKALESKPSAKPAPATKSVEEILADELEDLQADSEPHIKAKMEFGLKRQKAETAVSKRVAYLRNRLKGWKRPSMKKAAALLVGLLAFAFALMTPRAHADQQGYPQAFVTMTNIPTVINANGVSNLLSTTQVNFGLTNEVILHRGTGEALSWTFNGNSTLAAQSVTMFISPSVDGTNFDTWQQWLVVGKGFGVTNVTVTTNWNANQLAGYRALFVVGITNLTTGILTNGPVVWSTPQGGP